jgi:DnaJ-class molecular chaperone
MKIMASMLMFSALLGSCGGDSENSGGNDAASTTTCPDCDGHGVIVKESSTETRNPGGGGSFNSSKSRETCGRCKGTGKVKG